MVRAILQQVLDHLASSEDRLVIEAITQAYLLLDQDRRVRFLDRARRDEKEQSRLRSLPGGWFGWAERQSSRNHEEFGQLLPAQYVGLVLSGEEADAIVRGLVALLDRPPPVVRAAVGALRICARLEVIPSIVSVVRKYAATNGEVAQSAILTIIDILSRHDTRRSLTGDQERAVLSAIDVLRYAASEGSVDAMWDVRSSARKGLETAQRLISGG